jgi:hypothetical protein
MTNEIQMSWADVAELTHETQVEKFGFCTCEDGPRVYVDCPNEELDTLAEEYPLEAIEDYSKNHHESLDSVGEWADAFRDSYVGEQSAAEYAEELAISCGDLENVPDWIHYHIDWEGVGRDMLLGGDVWESDGGYLFRSN